MKLSLPFLIGSRLAPCLKVGDAFLSFDSGEFILDFADGSEHRITDFNFPKCRVSGITDERLLQDAFVSILSFLGACAESRQYATRRGMDPMEGENSDLFPESVGAWAEMNSDEISILGYDLEQADDLLTEGGAL